MQTASLTEWLNSPETRALVTYLKFRRGPGVAVFLRGDQVDPAMQARSVGCDEIIQLLSQPPEKIIEALENAKRELHGKEK